MLLDGCKEEGEDEEEAQEVETVSLLSFERKTRDATANIKKNTGNQHNNDSIKQINFVMNG